jgi:hypothetical protein
MKVESLGGNKYDFDLGGGPERIVADGTDQAAAFGTMLSVTVEGPDTWKVVRKKDGRMLLTGNWKLSQDGNTLTETATQNSIRKDRRPRQTTCSRERPAGQVLPGPGRARCP